MVSRADGKQLAGCLTLLEVIYGFHVSLRLIFCEQYNFIHYMLCLAILVRVVHMNAELDI